MEEGEIIKIYDCYKNRPYVLIHTTIWGTNNNIVDYICYKHYG